MTANNYRKDIMYNINDQIKNLREAKKEYEQKIAEIYINIAEMLKREKGNKENESIILSHIFNNSDVCKLADIEKIACQLIKIKDIKKYTMLGWKTLTRIKKIKHKLDRFVFDEVEKYFGDINDPVNLESYMLQRLFCKNEITSISNTQIIKYAKLGLTVDFFDKNNNLQELKGNNAGFKLFWIYHNAKTQENDNKSDGMIRNKDALIGQIQKMVSRITKQIISELKERYVIEKSEDLKSISIDTRIDEAKVYDLAFDSLRLLDLIQKINNGNYNYGFYSDEERNEIVKYFEKSSGDN